MIHRSLMVLLFSWENRVFPVAFKAVGIQKRTDDEAYYYIFYSFIHLNPPSNYFSLQDYIII